MGVVPPLVMVKYGSISLWEQGNLARAIIRSARGRVTEEDAQRAVSVLAPGFVSVVGIERLLQMRSLPALQELGRGNDGMPLQQWLAVARADFCADFVARARTASARVQASVVWEEIAKLPASASSVLRTPPDSLDFLKRHAADVQKARKKTWLGMIIFAVVVLLIGVHSVSTRRNSPLMSTVHGGAGILALNVLRHVAARVGCTEDPANVLNALRLRVQTLAAKGETRELLAPLTKPTAAFLRGLVQNDALVRLPRILDSLRHVMQGDVSAKLFAAVEDVLPERIRTALSG